MRTLSECASHKRRNPTQFPESGFYVYGTLCRYSGFDLLPASRGFDLVPSHARIASPRLTQLALLLTWRNHSNAVIRGEQHNATARNPIRFRLGRGRCIPSPFARHAIGALSVVTAAAVRISVESTASSATENGRSHYASGKPLAESASCVPLAYFHAHVIHDSGEGLKPRCDP